MKKRANKSAAAAPNLPATNPFHQQPVPSAKQPGKPGAVVALRAKQARAQKAPVTPETHPQRFTRDGQLKWKVAPPGVEVERNTLAEGSWIERWKSPRTGKMVYNYTQAFMEQRSLAKFQANRAFGQKLADIKKQLKVDLHSDGRERLLAAVVGCIQDAYFRVGNPQSAAQGVFGITTLQGRHVQFAPGTAVFEYIGKKRTQQRRVVQDPALVRALQTLARECKDPQAPLFQMDGQPISNREVNDYLRQFGITAKQFRTYHATRLCREKLLARGDVPKDMREKVEDEVVQEVAALLGHTPAVSRSSYIDPIVLKAFRAGCLQ